MENLVIIDVVEYVSNNTGQNLSKTDQIYMGVEARKSDDITCLSLMAPGATRRHNIEVSCVRAITVHGHRHVLETPPGRWAIRSQEIIRLIEGQFSEPWAEKYFDPLHEKYFKREEEYAPNEGTVDYAEIDSSYEDAPAGCRQRGCSCLSSLFRLMIILLVSGIVILVAISLLQK